jgi:hypothetical protein
MMQAGECTRVRGDNEAGWRRESGKRDDVRSIEGGWAGGEERGGTDESGMACVCPQCQSYVGASETQDRRKRVSMTLRSGVRRQRGRRACRTSRELWAAAWMLESGVGCEVGSKLTSMIRPHAGISSGGGGRGTPRNVNIREEVARRYDTCVRRTLRCQVAVPNCYAQSHSRFSFSLRSSASFSPFALHRPLVLRE